MLSLTAKLTRGVLFAGKTTEYLTLSDGASGFYQTTRIGLVCSTFCYVAKYSGRGVDIQPIGLPLGQDGRLLNSYVKLTTPAAGSPGLSPFAACVLILGAHQNSNSLHTVLN